MRGRAIHDARRECEFDCCGGSCVLTQKAVPSGVALLTSSLRSSECSLALDVCDRETRKLGADCETGRKSWFAGETIAASLGSLALLSRRAGARPFVW